MALVFWLLLCAGGGAVVGWLTAGGDSAWYQALDKPAWTPPGWVFAPVWTFLYVLMGIAAWLVSRRGGWARQSGPLGLFLMQLAVNFAWSFIFFGAHAIAAALVDMAVLWVLVLMTIRAFGRVEPRAGWLLVPYLVWITFAGALNTAIVAAN